MHATDLARYLAENNVAAKIRHLEDSTSTVAAAAAALGIQPNQIIKSLLFVIKQPDGQFRPLLVITNGTDRVDYVALANYAGTSRRAIRIASAEQVEALTGYRVGTVPPFGHKQRLPTVVDAGVLRQRLVYGGGGDLNALLEIAVEELQRVLATAEVVAVT